MLRIPAYRSPPAVVKLIVLLAAFGLLSQFAVLVYGFLSLPDLGAEDRFLKVMTIVTPLILLLFYVVLLYALWRGSKFGFIALVAMAAVTLARSGPVLLHGAPGGTYAYLLCLVLSALLLCRKDAREYFGFK